MFSNMIKQASKAGLEFDTTRHGDESKQSCKSYYTLWWLRFWRLQATPLSFALSYLYQCNNHALFLVFISHPHSLVSNVNTSLFKQNPHSFIFFFMGKCYNPTLLCHLFYMFFMFQVECFQIVMHHLTCVSIPIILVDFLRVSDGACFITQF